MRLFMYYFTAEKPYPRNEAGHLDPNFKREWVHALGTQRFDFGDQQHLDTWKTEWPTLSSSEKQKGMRNLCSIVGGKRRTPENVGSSYSDLARLDEYMSVFSDEDTLNFHRTVINSTLQERANKSHLIPTLTLIAHLTQWVRDNRPSAHGPCVEMLGNWSGLSHQQLYLDNTRWSTEWSPLVQLMPSTQLAKNVSIAGAFFGEASCLRVLLSMPDVDLVTLWQDTVGLLVESKNIGRMFSSLEYEEDPIFLRNAHQLGAWVLDNYNAARTAENVSADREYYPFEYDMFKTMVALGVPCQKNTQPLIQKNGDKWRIQQFFERLSALSAQWSAQQHEEMFLNWSNKDGYFVGEDLFGAPENIQSVLKALPLLPVAWTHWFENTYFSEMARCGVDFLSKNHAMTDHHWFHDNAPAVYERWIQGTAPNKALLEDSVVGDMAWRCTQAKDPQFLLMATMAWLGAPEVYFDIRHPKYPLAKLAWAREGVDLEARLGEAMQDSNACYPALILEALSPGKGKNRWHALSCLVDDLGERKENWVQHSLVQEVVLSCIRDAREPSTNELIIENVGMLFPLQE